jgi:hypothetical protein
LVRIREYCVTGTSTVNFNHEDIELAVDLCVSLGDIQSSGTTIPATGTLGLTILGTLFALVGVATVRRRQLS